MLGSISGFSELPITRENKKRNRITHIIQSKIHPQLSYKGPLSSTKIYDIIFFFFLLDTIAHGEKDKIKVFHVINGQHVGVIHYLAPLGYQIEISILYEFHIQMLFHPDHF